MIQSPLKRKGIKYMKFPPTSLRVMVNSRFKSILERL